MSELNLTELRLAIVKYWNVTPATLELRTAFSGGLWNRIAPHDAGLPRATYMIIDNIPNYSLGGDPTIETLRIQFDAWSGSTSIEVVANLTRLITKYFDDVKLTVTGYNVILFERVNVIPDRDEETNGHVDRIEYMVKM